ncbi:MAG: hypothetical protein COS99_06015 [Candidatus Omnitrophica bacterium CG07_land_8_20_14_0_80_42_15]|uniref:DNA ligase D 3'-phosphoesterase domain-containing protein n=1 Tax=Candidatus Aquitaenariimonas noxiae TaxID=1974741 RepID=A0A2J0L254_9BACT|nr:MAG: hypothetical protein COS99_06015 [Candidatus Omnitrophica bacterium CG07_land_8_20_14_0_80_42_15]
MKIKKEIKNRFVVQEHHAKRLHYDFRLEMNGVLASWVAPKGMPVESGIKRLAVKVEDHDLDYIDFEGEIEEGSYGAGKVFIWDSGVYTMEEDEKDRIVIELEGRKLTGRYALIKMKDKEKEWLLFKTLQKKN